MKKVFGLLTVLFLTASLAGCSDDPDPEEKKDENPPVEQENYNMDMKNGNMSPGSMRHGRYPQEQDGDMDQETERRKEEMMKKDMKKD
ncbi:hypothetical protein J9317_18910 [Metabacillus sp. KIGAM252]|uniref:Lipoprotein n=1 Tax=Metabacillus flavus TaxID=2823519 RepID=A0ABS5LJ92_9BACI|nr:hypothetical protein [Metabacillus flavus]MBS2970815.1 hypothetical protein [Metabacillus flavus]